MNMDETRIYHAIRYAFLAAKTDECPKPTSEKFIRLLNRQLGLIFGDLRYKVKVLGTSTSEESHAIIFEYRGNEYFAYYRLKDGELYRVIEQRRKR